MIGKKIEKNNVAIALNVLYAKKENISPAYVSKHNPNREKQVIVLMIPNGEKGRWHYLAVRKLLALLRGITVKHYIEFYCLEIAFILLEQKTNFNLIKMYVKIKIFVAL